MKMGWNLDEIDFQSARTQSREDELLFYMITAASYVEYAADTYTTNLVFRFGTKDGALHAWLNDVWRKEECRHGEALRRYVETVWPEFDWQRGYDRFLEEYSRTATAEALNASDALEMLERCIVETGTSSLYATLGAYAQDPLLKTICRHIQSDELHHYKHFYHYFERFNRLENRSRPQILRTILARTREIERDDSDIAFRHIYRIVHGKDAPEGVYEQFSQQIGARVVRNHFPYAMAVRLALQPLRLPGALQSGAVFFFDRLARRYFFAG